jgi:uncharacterized phiE125 gp8 family phage protein
MRLVPLAPPSLEPVALAEMKAHLRVDVADDDALIQSKIAAARQYAEQYTRRSFITQTWELVLDRALAELEVPLPPLQEVTKIEVVDAAGARTEVPAASYWVELGGGSCGRVRLADGCSWPSHRGFGSFIVTFKAGYGDAGADVPEKIREAIMKRAALLYEGREDTRILGANHPLTNEVQEVDALLFPYKVFRKSIA